MSRSTIAWSVLVLAGGLILLARSLASGEEPAAREQEPEERVSFADPSGPGPVPLDVFHPDVRAGKEPPAPRRGGSISVYLPGMPGSLNKVIDNSAATAAVLNEVHESLLARDWETWELEPRLAAGWDAEDALLLTDAGAERLGAAVVTLDSDAFEGGSARIVYGSASATADGYRVAPVSPASALAAPIEVRAEEVVSLERGTVFTFRLRDDVRWHDGHAFDAEDVRFSWRAFQNPHVDAEETRSLFRKVVGCEVPGPGLVRFFYARQFYLAADTVGQMTILPRHLYDLTDPDNEGHDATAGAETWGRYVNRNPCNDLWVGLGPYRVTKKDAQSVEAERFADYFDAGDPEHGGWLDRIRWKHVPMGTGLQAVLNGQLDLFPWLSTADYFGAETETPEFKERFVKGYLYTGTYSYTAWNLDRPLFADANVRRALAHAFDGEAFLAAQYHGLGKRVSGPPHRFTDAYDPSVLAPAHDPERARELLSEAGWYDRDGDGIVDRDGAPFRFSLLHSATDVAGRTWALLLQEDLAEVGVRMEIRSLEWATFRERVVERDFDAAYLAWSLDLENDPEQVWHSRWGEPGRKSSNHAAFRDAESDALIEAIQVELDRGRRMELWRAFHRRVASLDPYLFGVNAPFKFVLARRFRGLQTFVLPPGYSLRRLWDAGE